LDAGRCHMHRPKYMGASHVPSGVVHAYVLFKFFIYLAKYQIVTKFT
jgi:hypothetical protein